MELVVPRGAGHVEYELVVLVLVLELVIVGDLPLVLRSPCSRRFLSPFVVDGLVVLEYFAVLESVVLQLHVSF